MFINLLCLFLLARPCVVIIIFVVFAACGLVSVPELPAPTEPVTEASPCSRVHHLKCLAVARLSVLLLKSHLTSSRRHLHPDRHANPSRPNCCISSSTLPSLVPPTRMCLNHAPAHPRLSCRRRPLVSCLCTVQCVCVPGKCRGPATSVRYATTTATRTVPTSFQQKGED